MAKTPSKKIIPGSKNKGKAAVVKSASKPAKSVAATKPAAVAKKPAAAASKPAPVVAKKKPAVVAAPPPVPMKVVAKPAAIVAKPVAKAPLTKGAAGKNAIPKPPPAIMLVPRTPSLKGANGKPVTAPPVVKASTKASKAKAKAEKKAHVEPAYRPPLQESVPTDGKPRKNQAGLLSKELEHFRDLLLEKRREIVGDMSSMEREALRSGGGGLSSLPIHMADMGTDNYEQEFTLGLVEKDRILLRELNAALAKIQNGTYGLCEGTGKPINKVRLEAQPWAKFSIEWARQLERQRGLR